MSASRIRRSQVRKDVLEYKDLLKKGVGEGSFAISSHPYSNGGHAYVLRIPRVNIKRYMHGDVQSLSAR